MDSQLKRLLTALALVVACGSGKATLNVIDKCNSIPDLRWQYAYTEFWTTEEPIYGYHYDWLSGEYKYGDTGETETVEHHRDVYDCLPRR